MQLSTSVLVVILATSQSTPAGPNAASPRQLSLGVKPPVFVNSVTDGPTALLSGVIVGVQRAGAGSGVNWIAHTLSIRTDDGLKDAYVTSREGQHDLLPRVGARCELQYHMAETTVGPGPLVDHMWCNGHELPVFR